MQNWKEGKCCRLQLGCRYIHGFYQIPPIFYFYDSSSGRMQQSPRLNSSPSRPVISCSCSRLSVLDGIIMRDAMWHYLVFTRQVLLLLDCLLALLSRVGSSQLGWFSCGQSLQERKRVIIQIHMAPPKQTRQLFDKCINPLRCIGVGNN